MSEIGDTTPIQTSHVADVEPAEDEDMYGSDSGEVILKTREDPITRKDIQDLMNGWEDKFQKISEGVRALEMSTHDVHTHMDVVMRESRARESAQVSANKQMKSIQEALARFMEAYDPARQTPVSTFVRAHDGNMWSSASNASTHVRATSRAHDEHANHTVGSTAKIRNIASRPLWFRPHPQNARAETSTRGTSMSDQHTRMGMGMEATPK